MNVRDGSSVTDHEDLRMAGHAKILLDTHAAGAIRLRLEPLAGLRRRHPRGPDHRLAGDALAGYDDAIGVDMIHAVSEPNLDAELLEPTLRRRRQRLGKRREHTVPHIDQDDPRRRGIDPPELRS